ncbi:MAG: SH3 domain-containing protein [Anaerolineae bacterium]|nr:SH3 domain-containing protein [Anaerolineae bacterium]
MDDLRAILFGQQVAQLEEELDDVREQLADRDALVGLLAPVLGDAIRRQIRDARDEMIEALYPILGQLVVRAVSEAIRDLARKIDAQMRTSFSPAAIWRRIRARIGGASGGEVALREVLPFSVAEVLLIHRETGLLLWRVSRTPEARADSDLVSGMLTAIRDFAQDAFGRGQEGQLDEIQYGERRILVEAASHSYIAVVVDGIEPPGFRAQLREQIIEIDHTFRDTLRGYAGDPAPLAPVERMLRALLAGEGRDRLSRTQRWALGLSAILLLLCIISAIVGGRWIWRVHHVTPTAIPTLAPVGATATPTVAPTLTHTPTWTVVPSPTSSSTPTPSPTSTATPTVTATPTGTATPTRTPAPTATPSTIPGLMTGSFWVRQGPSVDTDKLGVVLWQGEVVEIVARYGAWYQVRWSPEPGLTATGWVPERWVGVSGPLPEHLVTPTALP